MSSVVAIEMMDLEVIADRARGNQAVDRGAHGQATSPGATERTFVTKSLEYILDHREAWDDLIQVQHRFENKGALFSPESRVASARSCSSSTRFVRFMRTVRATS